MSKDSKTPILLKAFSPIASTLYESPEKLADEYMVNVELEVPGRPFIKTAYLL